MPIDFSKTEELLKQFYTEQMHQQFDEMQAQQQAYNQEMNKYRTAEQYQAVPSSNWNDVQRSDTQYWSSTTVYPNTGSYPMPTQVTSTPADIPTPPLDWRTLFPDLRFHRAKEATGYCLVMIHATIKVRLLVPFTPFGAREQVYLAEPDAKLSTKEDIVFDLPPVSAAAASGLSVRMDPKLVINNLVFDYSIAEDNIYEATAAETKCVFSLPRRSISIVRMDVDSLMLLHATLKTGEKLIRYYGFDSAKKLVNAEVLYGGKSESKQFKVPIVLVA